MAKSEERTKPVVSPWSERIISWPAYATIAVVVMVVVVLLVVSLLD